jgi:hypothetical protein
LFPSISCPQAGFCMAVEAFSTFGLQGGSAWHWTGTSWTLDAVDEYPLESVSCSSTSFCIAVDGHDRYIRWNERSVAT